MKKRKIGTSIEDRILVKIAERADLSSNHIVDLRDIRLARALDHKTLAEGFQSRGYGTAIKINDDAGARVEFAISKDGRRIAEQIDAARYARSIRGKIARVPRSDWIAVFALATSVASAYISYLALQLGHAKPH